MVCCDVLRLCDIIPSDQLHKNTNNTRQLCFLSRRPHLLWPWKDAESEGEQSGERQRVLEQNPFRLGSEGDTERELESSPECVILGSKDAELCHLQRAPASGQDRASMFSEEDDDGGVEVGGANPDRQRESVRAEKAGALIVSLT